MDIRFKEYGIVEIDNARIIYRNFSGLGDKFNKAGNRSFSVVIPDEESKELLLNDKNEYGVAWNVKIKENADGDLYMHLPVKVKFNKRGPVIWLRTGDAMNKLDEESIDCLDNVDIESVDLDIRPYDDIVNGKPFRSAYLHSMCVTQSFRRDRFAERYNEEQ